MTVQPHVITSGHGVVLKLPCTEGQEVIRLFLAIFSSHSCPPATPQRLCLTIIGQNDTACRLVTSFPPDVLVLDIVSQTSKNIVTTIVVPCDRIHTWSVKSGLESGLESGFQSRLTVVMWTDWVWNTCHGSRVQGSQQNSPIVCTGGFRCTKEGKGREHIVCGNNNVGQGESTHNEV